MFHVLLIKGSFGELHTNLSDKVSPQLNLQNYLDNPRKTIRGAFEAPGNISELRSQKILDTIEPIEYVKTNKTIDKVHEQQAIESNNTLSDRDKQLSYLNDLTAYNEKKSLKNKLKSENETVTLNVQSKSGNVFTAEIQKSFLPKDALNYASSYKTLYENYANNFKNKNQGLDDYKNREKF